MNTLEDSVFQIVCVMVHDLIHNSSTKQGLITNHMNSRKPESFNTEWFPTRVVVGQFGGTKGS